MRARKEQAITAILMLMAFGVTVGIGTYASLVAAGATLLAMSTLLGLIAACSTVKGNNAINPFSVMATGATPFSLAMIHHVEIRQAALGQPILTMATATVLVVTLVLVAWYARSDKDDSPHADQQQNGKPIEGEPRKPQP